MNRIRVVAGAVVGVAALTLTACGSNSNPTGSTGSSAATGSPAASDTIVVGSANFQENVILADIYADGLSAKGVKVSKKLNIGSRETYIPGLKDGSIDLIPEYSGVLLQYFQPKATATTSDAVFSALQQAVPAPLTVLQQSAAQDKDAIVVTKATATKYNLTSIGDLASHASSLVFGGPPEFKTRPDGIPALKSLYGVTFGSYKSLDAGGPLTINALKNGQVDAADIFTTDPSIVKDNFVALQDPKNEFAAQNVLPLINSAKATATVKSTLNAISAKLTTDQLTQLVAKVVSDKQDPDAVAKAWLSSNGLS